MKRGCGSFEANMVVQMHQAPVRWIIGNQSTRGNGEHSFMVQRGMSLNISAGDGRLSVEKKEIAVS